MELIDDVIRIIDTNIILCLIPMILTLWFINSIFKGRFQSIKILNFAGWIIIFYSLITLIRFVFEVFTNYENIAIYNRATGPYWWSYWLMFLSATVLPFTLLFKKLRSKFWYVLIVAFGIKLGSFFEKFVIIVTSLHSDYLSSSWVFVDFPLIFGLFFLQGFLLAIFLLIIYNLIIRLKNKLYS